jgi:uncharacterized heparinase superfamily protein
MTLIQRIQNKVRQEAGRVAYNSPLYNWSLGGTVPEKILFSPCDLWQGSADNARWLIHSGAFCLGGDRLELKDANWHPENVSDEWLIHIHGFDWLRDLRALGGNIGRQSARLMICNWMESHQNWEEMSWRADVSGRRLGNWLAGYDFFGESASDEFQEEFLNMVVRQARHLSRSMPGLLNGLPLFYAVRGLIYVGLTLEGREDYVEQGLHILDEQIDKQILSDGGHISRNPKNLMETIRILIDVRAAIRQAGYPAIDKIQHALDRAVPALRFFRHGDGSFALVNGCQETIDEDIKNTVMHAGSRARALNSLPHSGYERVQMGRALLIADIGKKPVWPHDCQAHHAPLSFEFSYGRERIFVNCGTHPTCEKWQEALCSAPAHNTLMLNDALPQIIKKTTLDRDDKKEIVLIDASHDGYISSKGITHRRRFYVADKGQDFRGEDNLTCSTGLNNEHDVTIRFHLHPDVKVSLIKGGAEALLRLKSGAGWRFTIVGGSLALENSIYLGEGIRPRKTKQLIINGLMHNNYCQFKWALQRETK